MNPDIDHFCQALLRHIDHALQAYHGDAEYCHAAVQILDARNALFAHLDCAATDEERSIYALRDLCRMDPDTLLMRPDSLKVKAVARNFF